MKSAGDISRPFISISRSKPTSEWHDTYDEGYGLSSSRSVCPERIFSAQRCGRSLVALVCSILTQSYAA